MQSCQRTAGPVLRWPNESNSVAFIQSDPNEQAISWLQNCENEFEACNRVKVHLARCCVGRRKTSRLHLYSLIRMNKPSLGFKTVRMSSKHVIPFFMFFFMFIRRLLWTWPGMGQANPHQDPSWGRVCGSYGPMKCVIRMLGEGWQ